MEAAIGALLTGAEIFQLSSNFSAAQNQADILENEAKAAKQAQRINERIFREEADETLSEQSAGFAAQGIAGGASKFEVLKDTERKYMRDRRIREFNTQVQVSRLESQADATRSAAVGNLVGGLISTGAGNLARAGRDKERKTLLSSND